MTYDYGSIMHYGKTFFSANGKETLTPKVKNKRQVRSIQFQFLFGFAGCQRSYWGGQVDEHQGRRQVEGLVRLHQIVTDNEVKSK